MKTIKEDEIGDFFEPLPEEIQKRVRRTVKKYNKKTRVAKAVVVVNIKMDAETHELLMKKAKRNADGNLSAWLRYAGSKYVPKPDEKVKLRAA